MGDFYTEQLIKKKTDGKDIAIKILLIVLTVISFFIAFLLPLLILVPILFIVADVFLFRRMDVEYEYIYINGDLDIDKVMHKERRKHMLSVNVKDMELLAPEGAFQLQSYKTGKIYDYSSGITSAPNRYVLVFTRAGETAKILIEPNSDLVEGFFLMAPRKVIRK